MPDQQTLLTSTPAPGVLQLTVNRPEVHNAFDMATFAALDAELERAALDADIRAIVLAARGGKAFSAGFDIHEMARFDGAQMREAFEQRDPVMCKVATHPLPVIAAIDGLCFGAGALLSLACDMRLASPAFRFKVTAAGYGSANATWSLPRVVGPARAKAILMTARVVEAEEALRIGLIDEVVPAEALEQRAVELAASIAANPPAGVQAVKTLVDNALSLTPEQGWQAEYEYMMAQFAEPTPGGDMFDSFLSARRGKG